MSGHSFSQHKWRRAVAAHERFLDGTHYFKAAVRIGRRFYGAGIAVGGRPFRLWVCTGQTIWLWRLAMCAQVPESARNPRGLSS